MHEYCIFAKLDLHNSSMDPEFIQNGCVLLIFQPDHDDTGIDFNYIHAYKYFKCTTVRTSIDHIH